MAYLEKLRLDKLRQSCVVIQKHIRGWLQRKKFLRERQAALTIQQYFRGQQTVRYTRAEEARGWVRGKGGLEPGDEKVIPLGQGVLTLPTVPTTEVTSRTLKL